MPRKEVDPLTEVKAPVVVEWQVIVGDLLDELLCAAVDLV